jgi:hypothetical protein
MVLTASSVTEYVVPSVSPPIVSGLVVPVAVSHGPVPSSW